MKTFFIGVLCFLLGIGTVVLYQQSIGKSQAEEWQQVLGSGITISPSPTPVKYIEKLITPTVSSVSYSLPSSKSTILQSQPLTADRTEVETGENVNFKTALKNTGTKMKHLTHICFNHSGGETFGCLLKVNIYPGDEFEFQNGMIFRSPGTYQVYLTWSQDEVNFYRPNSAKSVTVRVK